MFFRNIHTRIRFMFIIIIISIIIIICRVFYIQVFLYDKLNTLANDLWSRNLPISANRGLITDRNGKILADNITTTSLVIVPNQVKDKEKSAKLISNILDTSYEEILKHFNKKVSIERVHPEGRRLDYETADKINDLNIDGIYLLKESKRYYPYNDVLSHVLGYVGIDNQGLSGIELYYDKYLTGENGSIKYFSDGKGGKLELTEVYEKPTSGLTVELTIDLELQLAAENELDKVISKYDPKGAMILAMEPNTGEILAMASRPNFDSNNYKNYNAEVINRNLPIWMTYEPGSTFKIITLSASIEEKTVDLFNDTFNDSGKINVDGAKIHCWKTGGHGHQTYLEVVQNSCNPGFVSLGQKLGTKKLMSYIKDFGFGNKTGIDLNGESSGILFDIDKMGPVETATTAFGQGVSVTALQQVNAVSAVVNGGTLYNPFIVSGILDPLSNSSIKTIGPNKIKEVISKETSELTRFALENVVAKGSGKNAYIENYRIGGKTGTAQKVVDGKYSDTEYILSFIGFMPADNPEIVLYVAIDSPKNVVQYGGVAAAPIAKNLFNTAISLYDFKETKDTIPKEYTWLDEKYVVMPSVNNKSLEEAKKLLKGFKIEYSGDGNNVFYQSIKEGSFVKEGSTILLHLN